MYSLSYHTVHVRGVQSMFCKPFQCRDHRTAALQRADTTGTTDVRPPEHLLGAMLMPATP